MIAIQKAIKVLESDLNDSLAHLYWEAEESLRYCEESYYPEVQQYLYDKLVSRSISNPHALRAIIYGVNTSGKFIPKHKLLEVLLPYLFYTTERTCIDSEEEQVAVMVIQKLINLRIFNLSEVKALESKDNPYIQLALLEYRLCSMSTKAEQIEQIILSLDSPITLIKEWAIDELEDLGFMSPVLSHLQSQERVYGWEDIRYKLIKNMRSTYNKLI
jgi:hypothetical protein